MSLENQELSQPINSNKSLLVGNRFIRSNTFTIQTLVMDEEICPEVIFLDTPDHNRYVGTFNSPIYASYQLTKKVPNEGPIRDTVPTPDIYFKYNFEKGNSKTHILTVPDTLDKVCTDILLAVNYDMNPTLQSLFEEGLLGYPDIEGECIAISSKQLTDKGIAGLKIKIGNNGLVYKTSSTPGIFFNIKNKTLGIIYSLADNVAGIITFPLYGIEEWFFLQTNKQEKPISSP